MPDGNGHLALLIGLNPEGLASGGAGSFRQLEPNTCLWVKDGSSLQQWGWVLWKWQTGAHTGFLVQFGTSVVPLRWCALKKNFVIWGSRLVGGHWWNQCQRWLLCGRFQITWNLRESVFFPTSISMSKIPVMGRSYPLAPWAGLTQSMEEGGHKWAGMVWKVLSLMQEKSAPVSYITLVEIAFCKFTIKYGWCELVAGFCLLITLQAWLIKFTKW